MAALQAEARFALESEDPARIAMATAALDAAAQRHLVPVRKSRTREFVEVIALAILGALALRFFAVEAYRIPSGSMIPTLQPGDVVLVSKLDYGLRLFGRELLEGEPPKRGDVVVFENPATPGQVLIKRVAGVAGDVIEIVDEQVRLNGEPQPRAEVTARFDFWNYRDDLGYWHPQSGLLYLEDLDGRRHATLHSRLAPRPRPTEGPFEVPPGHVFVLGDNRDESEDGRSDGGWYVPVDKVRGRARLLWFSWGHGGLGLAETGLRLGRILRFVDGSMPEGDLPAAVEAHRAYVASE